MNIQSMLYIYLAICISMMFFNAVYAMVLRGRDKNYDKARAHLRNEIEAELQNVVNGAPISEKHIEHAKRFSRKVTGLLLADSVFQEYAEAGDERLEPYFTKMAPIYGVMLGDRRYKTPFKQAFLTYFCATYKMFALCPTAFDLNTILEHTDWNDTYCRENALKLIYSSGRSDYVLEALFLYDASEGYHNTKMITDGLLTFAGDREELAEELWLDFEKFSPDTRVAIINFFRFGNIHKEDEILELLNDKRQDDEMHFACIRYFGKFAYEDAYETIIEFSENPDDQRWECASIANTSLLSYPEERTVESLKYSLSSPNWYIRFNAAKSLEAMHYSYEEIMSTIDISDRYAQEIMQYCLDLSMAKGKGKAK